MEYQFGFIALIIAVALAFDFTNGFHDAANSTATVVATGTLSRRKAVVMAALCNFFALWVFGTAVAKTVGKGLVNIDAVTPKVILAGLLGAIAWNLITWWFKMPSSSSHALIAGYTGAAVAKSGTEVVLASGWLPMVLFIFLAPLIGFALGWILQSIANKISFLSSASEDDQKWPRRLQIVSAMLYSIAHGGNDAQKTMGIIAGLLFSAKMIPEFYIPFWVMLAAHIAIALGTLFGGWRIAETIGEGVGKKELTPSNGCAAETSGAISIWLAIYFGIAVSTTHVICGAVAGVVRKSSRSDVRWSTLVKMAATWALTIPASGIIGFLLYEIIRLVID